MMERDFWNWLEYYIFSLFDLNFYKGIKNEKFVKILFLKNWYNKRGLLRKI